MLHSLLISLFLFPWRVGVIIDNRAWAVYSWSL